MQVCKTIPQTVPQIVLDESIFSDKLYKKLCRLGYDMKFLGHGITDEKILKYVENNNAVLITSDIELDSYFTWKKSLLLENWYSVKDKINVISAFISTLS